MADYHKPYGKTQQTDDERRKAAGKASSPKPVGSRDTQANPAPNEPTEPKEAARGASHKESFEHAGRAVRAPPRTRQDSVNQRKTDIDEDTDPSTPGANQPDVKIDEDADPRERSERKARARRTADEEED